MVGAVDEINIDAITGAYEEAAAARRTAVRAMLIAALALAVATVELMVLLFR
jgi:hypothetical protein